MAIGNESSTEFNINHGLDTSKPTDPLAGSVYLATDTGKMYVCYTDGVWQVASPLSINKGGVLLFNGKTIIPYNETITDKTIDAPPHPVPTVINAVEIEPARAVFVFTKMSSKPNNNASTAYPLRFERRGADGVTVINSWEDPAFYMNKTIPANVLTDFSKSGDGTRIFVLLRSYSGSVYCTLTYSGFSSYLEVDQ